MDSFMAEKVKYKTQILIGISMKWMKNYERKEYVKWKD